MKRSKDNHDNLKKVLDNFIPIDRAIDLSLQEEYVGFSETIDFDNVDYEEVKCLRELSITSHFWISSYNTIFQMLIV
jgi:hypothetical protein